MSIALQTFQNHFQQRQNNVTIYCFYFFLNFQILSSARTISIKYYLLMSNFIVTITRKSNAIMVVLQVKQCFYSNTGSNSWNAIRFQTFYRVRFGSLLVLFTDQSNLEVSSRCLNLIYTKLHLSSIIRTNTSVKDCFVFICTCYLNLMLIISFIL